MQEQMEFQFNSTSLSSDNFLYPQMISIEDQKQILKCPNHNQAYSVCISSQCLMPGLMCLEATCQCRETHYKCHHILLDRVMKSIQKHQKKLPQKAKDTYLTIYQNINSLIDKLSNLRTKFERQQQYFGLRQEQLLLMDLISQNKIQSVNGKIISSLQKTFDAQFELNKNSKQDIIKDFQDKKKQFDKLCSSIQVSYLQIKSETKFLIKSDLLKDSKIVKQREEIQLINKWLCEASNPNDTKKQLKSQLLYRASQHNFQSDKFHELCDGKKNTLIVIRNEYDKIIGGYTPQPWHSRHRQYSKDKYAKSFLYSLNLKQKYSCINPQFSIQGFNKYGPIFGLSQSDLTICDKCNEKRQSYAMLGRSYNIHQKNVNKYKYKDQQTQKAFIGNQTNQFFKVKQYEVYQIHNL